MTRANEALPKKLETECFPNMHESARNFGYNGCCDDISTIHLEVDVEAMAEILKNNPYRLSMSLKELSKYLSDNIPKWARLVRK